MTPEAAFRKMVALGIFSVDGEGRIWRHKTLTRGSFRLKPKIKDLPAPRRAETNGPKGYLMIHFRDPDTSIQYHVLAHRAVWAWFHDKDIPEGMEINHWWGNKRDNHPDNLICGTSGENKRHAVDVLGKMRGENHHFAKLTDEQVIEIWNYCKDHIRHWRIV